MDLEALSQILNCASRMKFLIVVFLLTLAASGMEGYLVNRQNRKPSGGAKPGSSAGGAAGGPRPVSGAKPGSSPTGKPSGGPRPGSGAKPWLSTAGKPKGGAKPGSSAGGAAGGPRPVSGAKPRSSPAGKPGSPNFLAGSYRQLPDGRVQFVTLPDGRGVQFVTFTADHHNGFVADVKSEGYVGSALPGADANGPMPENSQN